MEFKDFALRPEVLAALEAKGFTTPTAIQAQAIPLALEGRDVLGQARTGTGKTLAFALPIAHKLEAPFRGDSRVASRQRGRPPRAFILTPTRELALQVAGELAWVAPHLHVLPIYGGTGYGSQAEGLRRGADVVVATPGRAIDYLNQGILDLSHVEIAVLDEADEMLSMGFEEDVEKLLGATPASRQTFLFSATVPSWAKRLAERYMRDPVHVNVVKDEQVSYEELALQAPLQTRLNTLTDVIFAYAPERTIVFTRTKAEVDELATGLQARGIGAAPIHGDMSQRERERVLGRFREGTDTVLVATDVAARGLDIPEVDLVVHFRLPEKAEPYQHRSGRTGRAGRSGRVILFYGPRERRELENLEYAVKRRFKRVNPPTPEEVQEAKWQRLLARLAKQPPHERAPWRELADRLVNDREAIAGLLAFMLGTVSAPKSLITGEEGLVTVKLSGQRLTIARVVAVLKKAGAGRIGRIVLSQDAAYIDVQADELESIQQNLSEFHLSRAHEVPAESPSRERRESEGRTPRRERSYSERRRVVSR
ncbi:DEAD/DEAH box helicase domain protein [Allomeiothermus silvanus DSM 9946]|uniref:DEAD/DEAH box helicase domain protein n=1 Tax=Allomeiothermus silvanus (strain ATCC 700542 / DSM 9946 / NBRC 106475 / NCIMB 13440 / VI-R2) TaxID=526227 RepID=D7BB77_ALLS1|nr:DEAD/DEAH box helicase [Allomeiothermus silvanus]ADH62637.1 DEAD/DEAH box helicase domain protein [Allomeiothermus silvanus DSM 9946]